MQSQRAPGGGEGFSISNRVDPKAVKKLLFFTLLMIVAPLTSFFGSKKVLEDMEHPSASIYSAGIAVAVVQIVMIAFVYVAFFEASRD
eukprot:Nk52_evm2s642 gene=Nk52_evmTU2s642